MDTTGSSLTQVTVTFPAAVEALGEMHGALDRFWTDADATVWPPPGGRWRLEFATALAEIVANVLRHAAPTSPVELRLDLSRGGVKASIRDDGRAYVPSDPVAGSTPTDLPEGGYGLALARAALDELSYERRPDGTNHWQLVKSWPVSTSGGPR